MGSFYPPQRTLMGPGPSDVNPRVLNALARPTIGHLDPAFIVLMDQIKGLLQYAFQTQNELTLAVSAPGSAGMETCFVNLVERGDTVIIAQNGVFGARMKENVLRCGATPVMIEDPWGQAINLDRVREVIEAHPQASVVACVHAETSTGACSDVGAICQMAAAAGMLSIVDTVTGLGGIEVAVDAWGADAVYSGSQKCLSCIPGLSPVTFSDRAVTRIQERKTPVQSWFLDLNLVMGYWGGGAKRAYHHTAPINPLYGLHESLTILEEEGLQGSWARHALNHQALKAGLNALSLDLLVAPAARLPQLNAVQIPNGIDEAQVRATLLQEFDLEIGAGLGALAGKVWRIGLMGYASRPSNVRLCLSALESALARQGHVIRAGEAIAAANAVYA